MNMDFDSADILYGELVHLFVRTRAHFDARLNAILNSEFELTSKHSEHEEKADTVKDSSVRNRKHGTSYKTIDNRGDVYDKIPSQSNEKQQMFEFEATPRSPCVDLIKQLHTGSRNGYRLMRHKLREPSNFSRTVAAVVSVVVVLLAWKMYPYVEEKIYLWGENNIYFLQSSCRQIGLLFFRVFSLLSVSPATMYKTFSRAGCLIDNPLFDSKSGLDCYGCDSFTHVLTPKKTAGKGPLKEDLILGPQPIVFRNWGRNASLQDLQAVLQANEDLMDEWGVGINSSLPAISNLKDLRSDDIIQQMEANPHFYFSWSAFMYSSSYLVRKLFPRPLFAPRSMNVQLEKMLYIVGKDTPGFVMQHPLISQWVAWYAQGYGQRKVVLNPPRHCMRKCNSYSLTMHPGDLLSFDSRIWQATSEPSGSTTSMAVLGFFDS